MLEGYSIERPGLLHISNGSPVPYYGGSQLWYKKFWKRLAGCGPTTAANLLYYLARTREGCKALAPDAAASKQEFLGLMEESWRFVTPGRQGVNSTAMFAEGIARFGQQRGVRLLAETLDVAADPEEASKNNVARFLGAAFQQDLPVAFLNLHHGKLTNLESWHWVALVAYNPGSQDAIMYDQGRRVRIPLGRWLETTRMGGGFVAVRPG